MDKERRWRTNIENELNEYHGPECGFGRKCDKHSGMIHGAEAEELRSGIERIIEDGRFHLDHTITQLQRLLESVDARDSLAWIEKNET